MTVHTLMEPPPRVLFIPFRGEPVAAGLPIRRWKLRAVWDNLGRNAFMAGLAAGLVKTPRRTLRKLGIKVESGVFHPGRRRRVVVLAETAEHARRLERFLPNWVVKDAVQATDHPGQGWHAEPVQDEQPPPGVIATLVYAAKYGVKCDVLVRATAGTGKLNWGTIIGRNRLHAETPALVIDFMDDSGDRERTDSTVRRREYREQQLEEVKRRFVAKGDS